MNEIILLIGASLAVLFSIASIFFNFGLKKSVIKVSKREETFQGEQPEELNDSYVERLFNYVSNWIETDKKIHFEVQREYNEKYRFWINNLVAKIVSQYFGSVITATVNKILDSLQR